MKTILDLETKTITMIDQWLKNETSAFYDHHHYYPTGSQREDVVDNVYPKLQPEGIYISYGELYDHYLSLPIHQS